MPSKLKLLFASQYKGVNQYDPIKYYYWPIFGRMYRQRVDLAQVARELVLLESSDWPFLISTGQAKEYASGRFQQHMARFNHLAVAAERGGALSEADRRFLDTTAELDNPFPQIQYKDFAEREDAALKTGLSGA